MQYKVVWALPTGSVETSLSADSYVKSADGICFYRGGTTQSHSVFDIPNPSLVLFIEVKAEEED